MTDFTVHTLDTAPADSRQLLERSKQLYGGMIPNIHGVMAEAPALLEAYQALNEIFAKTSLSAAEQNIVWLAVNYVNECTYCMAAHTVVALHSGLSDVDIDALRTGHALENPKHQALRDFTEHLVRQRGWPDKAVMQRLLDAGYTQATILEVILAIGMKTLSNYTNHVADTPLDKAFVKQTWIRPD